MVAYTLAKPEVMDDVLLRAKVYELIDAVNVLLIDLQRRQAFDILPTPKGGGFLRRNGVRPQVG